MDSISVQSANGRWIGDMVGRSGGRIINVANTAVSERSTAQALVDFETNIRPLAGQVDVVCYEEVIHSITNGLTVTQFPDNV